MLEEHAAARARADARMGPGERRGDVVDWWTACVLRQTALRNGDIEKLMVRFPF